MLSQMNKIYILAIILFLILLPTYSMAQNWEVVRQADLEGNLHEVFFVNANEGWAVTSGYPSPGMVIHTDDGGKSWNPQIKIDERDLWGICFVDVNAGWAVGSMGLIIHTIDGGKTWEKQADDNKQDLRSVNFVNENVGWAVGYDWTEGRVGLILHTDDGGKVWVRQDSKADSDYFMDVSFVNEKTGWVVSSSKNYVLHTDDGGQTWVRQAEDIVQQGLVNNCSCIQFLDEKVGWAAGIMLGVIHTTDGGKTWVKKQRPNNLDFFPENIYFADEKTGWTVGQRGKIYKTSDGGETWTKQNSNTLNRISSIYLTDANTGWAVGESDTILHTTDGGDNWTPQTSKSSNILNDIYFADENNGWVVGWNGTFLRTRDSGKTWQENVVNGLGASVFFIDDLEGWSAGEFDGGQGIFHTTDGGETWQGQKSPTWKNLLDIQFINRKTGWISAGGAIINTNDGGATWTIQLDEIRGWMWDIDFVDENNGWSVGTGDQGGVLLYTNDGGVNWIKQSIGMYPKGVDFINRNVGWAVGEYSIIMHTTDGGKIWEYQKCPENCYLEDVCFVNERQGWAVGWTGMILYTSDGGITWTKQETGIENDLYSICFDGKDTLWAVGGWGIILKCKVEITKSVEPDGKLPTTWGKVRDSTLFQNYPNPFNPETWMPYQLGEDADVVIKIYSSSGKLVRTINVGLMSAGLYLNRENAVYWDGRDDSGEKVVSDEYFYTLKTGKFTDTKKMVIIR